MEEEKTKNPRLSNNSFSVRYEDSLGAKKKEDTFCVVTPKGKYNAKSILAQGEFSQVFHAETTNTTGNTEKVVLKIALGKEENAFLHREVQTLTLFESVQSPQKKHLPRIVDQFQTDTGRLGTILTHIDGYDFESILERFPSGLASEHVFWILRRLLSVVGFAHLQGVIHGNIEPSHIMVRPKDHNVTLIDWCYSLISPAKSGEKFSCYNPEYSGPEIQERKTPLPSSDLYSIGKCAIRLLGGDVHTDTLPDHIDKRFVRFLQYLVRKSPIQRAQDAWEMYQELGSLRKKIYGKHRFVPLHV